jgi:hypothetical protein
MTTHLYSQLGDTREHTTSCALVTSQPWRQPGCTCIIDAAGTRYEMRVVSASCAVHGEGSR